MHATSIVLFVEFSIYIPVKWIMFWPKKPTKMDYEWFAIHYLLPESGFQRSIQLRDPVMWHSPSNLQRILHKNREYILCLTSSPVVAYWYVVALVPNAPQRMK